MISYKKNISSSSNLFKCFAHLVASTVDKIRWIKLKKYTKFEKARIIGARALQISMGAPSIIKIPKEIQSPLDIAMLEFKEDAIPITVKRVGD